MAESHLLPQRKNLKHCPVLVDHYIELKPTTMGFSVSQENTNFSYAGTSLNGLFSQRLNLINFKFWRMLFDIFRFNHKASGEVNLNISMQDYLKSKGYSNIT